MRAIGLSPDRLDQILRPENLDRPLYIVCQHVQAHLGSDFRERFGQEMRRPHPRFDCPEGMLDR